MAKVGIAVIHGMGSQKKGFERPMVEELTNRLAKLGVGQSDVAWEPIYWANVTEPRQMEYFKDADRDGDLDWKKLRKFVLTALGDASGYRKTGDTKNDIYDAIHAIVGQALAQLSKQVSSPNAPLIWIAHNLGGHIMSNYIYDTQKSVTAGKLKNKSKFERLETLRGILTFGCNIPLFTFAYRKSEVKPIKLPRGAVWDNYYDPDDVLGYPLKPISAAYNKTVRSDFSINSGGIATSWTPLSHNGYWTDNDFTKPAAQFIADIVNAAP